MSNPNQEVPKITVNFIDDPESGELTPHWYMNHQDMGQVDWAMTSDEQHGFVDFLGHTSFILEKRLGRLILPALAKDFRAIYPRLETIDFPPEFHDHQEVFENVT